MLSAIHTPKLRQVGEVLVDEGVITRAQLEEALGAQRAASERRLLGEVLIQRGYCTEIQLLEALAKAYEIPFARLTPRLVDPAVASLLPYEYARTHAALPLFLVDGVLTVAVAEPANVYLVEEIAQQTGNQVQLVAAPRSDILATAEAAFHERPNDSGAMDEILAEARQSVDVQFPAHADEPPDDEQLAGDAPVVKLVNQLVASAVREGASDVHFEPGDHACRIRVRVDGRLYEKMKPPYQMAPALVARIKVMAGMDIAERRLPQDGAIRINIDGRPIDLRVSTLPNRFGEKVVMRILDTQNALIGLDHLNMDPAVLEQFREQIHKPHGIVLVTGPTGSGKSTTLYSALAAVSSTDINIATVEDPIEYNLPGINQFQVHERIGLTFPAVLRSLLRQDPDVIMVGEIRDPETGRIAVQAALTGHLVLSTLHTNDAPSAVTRLLNLGVESYLLSAAVEAVLAQRLIRRICPECKAEAPIPPHVRRALERLHIDAATGFVGRGCVKCHQSGMRGRLGVFELMPMTDALRDAIGQGAPTARLREIAAADGMKTLLASGVDRAAAGETTYEEVLRVTTGLGRSE